ncbi:MAG: UvrD-helicase domain-containing protein [Victivallales bacterium]|nr:UvrD-helicase domain-containing protein [Victivallales bacterium]
MTPSTPLWDSLDLGSHAVIEASAGTGKTFTIERLVARILRDVPEASIDRLLLLTYTEKATGELRERIRAHLAEEMAQLEGPTAQRFRDAVENFDTAQVFTIHGFCQRVLQEYAFENGQLFDLELSGDGTALKRLFREQLRTVWQREHLPKLPRESAVSLAEGDFQEEDILRLVATMQPDDLLLPDVPSEPEAVVSELAEAIQDLRLLVGDGSEFMDAYWQLKLGKANDVSGLTKRSIEPIWHGLWEVVGRSASLDALSRAAAWYGEIGYKRFRDGDDEIWRGFRVLVPPALRLPGGGIEAEASCPQLAAVIEVLCGKLVPALRRGQLLSVDAEVGIVQASVRALQARYEDLKQEEGLLDFDDMLVRVRTALSPECPRSETLLAALRAKYWFALVDEFQDTDPIQWEIFRRIFVEHDDGPQRLFLIGDPKQAIYGFRGADVNTYLEARDALVGRFGPLVLHSLGTNFRSIPKLLAGLNQVFGAPEWFPDEASGEGISYAPVDWPEDEIRGVGVARDGTRRPPLCLIHLNEPGLATTRLTIARARWRLAHFIGAEIARLLAEPEQFRFVIPGEGECLRELSAGDFCILVRRRASARPIESVLRELGVPYTFYKKPGIYQSAEALHTSLMLGALADPDAARALHPALLSRFFGRTPGELAQNPAGVEHETRGYFERWRERCRERRWSLLFRSLLEDTGLVFREALEPDGDRRLANYRQLFQELAALAERQSLDVAGLREQLDLRRRRSVAVGGEEDLHHLDTERPKVTIMTMHASKGLQFPIVFIADGFSALGRTAGSSITYHVAGHRVVELKTSDGFAGAAKAKQESTDETKRLFYVALTRARFKVYVPFGWNPDGKPLTPLLTPTFAPFWERGDDPQNDDTACHLDTTGQIIGTGYPAPPIDQMEAPASVPPEPTRTDDEIAQALADLQALPHLGRWRRQVDSYSSLAQDHGPGASGIQYGERDNHAVADDWGGGQREEETLVPPGAAAGTALHEILEEADFSQVCRYDNPAELLAEQPDVAALVQTAMIRNGLVDSKRWHPDGSIAASTSTELAGMALRALTTPLDATGFRLGKLSPADRQTELEFHLSEGESVLGADQAVPAGRRGLLNGFIDLIYRRDGRYYIVDWKSNALAAGYGPEQIQASMDEHEYTLQFRIYALALAAWLEQCLPDFCPDRHLGGVYYLYVRGLNGVDASSGVFHQRLNAAFLASCRREVLDRLAAR